MKQILILGSGMMSSSLVTCLIKRPENNIVIASNIIEDAEKLCKQFDRCTPAYCDVSNEVFLQKLKENLGNLIETCDIVISFVPAPCHPLIAKVCLKYNKNLITSSYISPQMKELDQQAKQKGLIFLNECGLDPGIDHILTMKLLEKLNGLNATDKEFYSFCGGLPSPDACDNSLGYKFSWSPIGALNALRNSAKYLKNSMEMNIPAESVLYVAQKMDINKALNLEGYPNRDSTKYIELYGLQDFQTVMRGTLRYQGFTFLMAAIIEIGLLNQEILDYKGEDNLPSYLQYMLNSVQVNFEENFEQKNMEKKLIQVSKDCGITQTDLALKIIKKSLDIKHYHFNEQEMIEKSILLLDCLNELGLFNQQVKINLKKSPLENICSYFEKRLAYKVILFLLKQGEKDCVILQNIIKYKENNIQKQMKATLLMIGGNNNLSAMALTVGGPSAIAAQVQLFLLQLVLDNKITLKGVHMPNQKEIWEQIYEQLSQMGIDIKISY